MLTNQDKHSECVLKFDRGIGRLNTRFDRIDRRFEEFERRLGEVGDRLEVCVRLLERRFPA
jgi:hypothetical protein